MSDASTSSADSVPATASGSPRLSTYVAILSLPEQVRNRIVLKVAVHGGTLGIGRRGIRAENLAHGGKFGVSKCVPLLSAFHRWRVENAFRGRPKQLQSLGPTCRDAEM
eukprot:scaffold47_cov258-Pinguiococcus_pyrenoidosus.AAC.54